MDLKGDLSQTRILGCCDGFAVRRMGRGSRLRRRVALYVLRFAFCEFGTVFWSLCVASPQPNGLWMRSFGNFN